LLGPKNESPIQNDRCARPLVCVFRAKVSLDETH
jgi:hypothetical protein